MQSRRLSANKLRWLVAERITRTACRDNHIYLLDILRSAYYLTPHGGAYTRCVRMTHFRNVQTRPTSSRRRLAVDGGKMSFAGQPAADSYNAWRDRRDDERHEAPNMPYPGCPTARQANGKLVTYGHVAGTAGLPYNPGGLRRAAKRRRLASMGDVSCRKQACQSSRTPQCRPGGA